MSSIATARLRYLRVAPRKVRLLATLIRGRQVGDALNQLNFSPKGASMAVAKLLKSAIANAGQKEGVDIDRLYVQKIWVDGGPIMKRFMPRAQGRATPIQKKTSHITIELEQR